MLRAAVLLALLLLGACANQELAKRRAFLTSMVGQSEIDLVRQMGVPTRSFDLNGERFLAYDDRRLDYVPGFYTGPPWWGPGWGGWGWGWGWAPPMVIARGCEATFEIRAGKVASYSLRGPEC